MTKCLGPYLPSCSNQFFKTGQNCENHFWILENRQPRAATPQRVGSVQKQILFSSCSEDRARVKALWAVHRQSRVLERQQHHRKHSEILHRHPHGSLSHMRVTISSVQANMAGDWELKSSQTFCLSFWRLKRDNSKPSLTTRPQM